MEDVQAGEMPVPFPGSWCRLSGKGSLRQEQMLGSPQPACVSSFLRVGSSNIHCSRARRTGTYHLGAGRGGDAGRGVCGLGGCRGGLCGYASRVEGRRQCAIPPPVPPSFCPYPRDRACAGSSPSGWALSGREEVRGLRDTRAR